MGLRSRLFWASAAIVGYTYVGFPTIVLMRGRLRPAPYRTADITPTVSLLVAAHNEAGGIARRLENALALDYPADRLEIVVASDGIGRRNRGHRRDLRRARRQAPAAPAAGKGVRPERRGRRIDRRDPGVLRREQPLRHRRGPTPGATVRRSIGRRGCGQPALSSRVGVGRDDRRRTGVLGLRSPPQRG